MQSMKGEFDFFEVLSSIGIIMLYNMRHPTHLTHSTWNIHYEFKNWSMRFPKPKVKNLMLAGAIFVAVQWFNFNQWVATVLQSEKVMGSIVIDTVLRGFLRYFLSFLFNA